MCFVFLSFCIPQSAISTPKSKQGGGLMLWIMDGPKGEKLKVMSYES